jgi:hypothetical protein
MTYDHKQIADELEATAKGKSYFGNALYVARDFPWTTHNDRALLTRYLHGSASMDDNAKLIEFAHISRNEGESK